VSVLLDAGCPIDVVDIKGSSALHYATEGGAVEVIGGSALHYAAEGGAVEVFW
jgi:ankyrin repeat protein